MLKIAESHLKGEKAPVLLVDKIFKKKGKKCSKKKMNPKASILNKKAKKVSTKSTCYHCSKDGYWKRNYKEYLVTLKHKKINIAKDLYMIQTNLLLSTSTLDF